MQLYAIVALDSKEARLRRATISDITAPQQAEEALGESEELYRSWFENMLNGFAYGKMLFDQNHPQDFIYLNAYVSGATGLTCS